MEAAFDTLLLTFGIMECFYSQIFFRVHFIQSDAGDVTIDSNMESESCHEI